MSIFQSVFVGLSLGCAAIFGLLGIGEIVHEEGEARALGGWLVGAVFFLGVVFAITGIL